MVGEFAFRRERRIMRIFNDWVYRRAARLLSRFEIMESLIKSVYRFMARMEKLTVMEEEILKFVRSSFRLSRSKMKQELEKFLMSANVQ